MQIWRNMFLSSRAIIILLVVAVFTLAAFQTHLHIHNIDMHESHHSHSVDMHIFNEGVLQDHHESSTVIEIKFAGIFKKQLADNLMPMLAVAMFSLLIVCLFKLISRVISNPAILYPKSRHRYFIPLLRAPPQL